MEGDKISKITFGLVMVSFLLSRNSVLSHIIDISGYVNNVFDLMNTFKSDEIALQFLLNFLCKIPVILKLIIP